VRLGLRGVARPGGAVIHLLLAGSAADSVAALRGCIART
jgi:hypothetical protein